MDDINTSTSIITNHMIYQWIHSEVNCCLGFCSFYRGRLQRLKGDLDGSVLYFLRLDEVKDVLGFSNFGAIASYP